jgi:DNA-binding protein WhiA
MTKHTVTTFNRNTKNAVLSAKIAKKCCKKAHLAGILLFGQSFTQNEIRLVTENVSIIDHTVSLIKNLVGIDVSDCIESFSAQERLTIKDEERCKKILSFLGYENLMSTYTIDEKLFRCDKCKIEFLKGAFLSCGNVSSPEKSYHLEMSVAFFNLSRELLFFLKGLYLEAKYTKRASHYVIYYKESEKIVDFLGLVGATQENFEYSNTLIEKDIRNNVNRVTNCEMANLSKQATTAGKQIAAIKRIFESGAQGELSDELLETANLRLQYPDASLASLASLHQPPVTKSCVNRRLTKLIEISGN